MNTSLLLQSIAKHIHLSGEETAFFVSLLHEKKLRRKQFLSQEGDINRAVNFVNSGILRLYAVDKNGFDHIIQFAPAGWWIGDMQSLLKQQPANLNIDAIEETELLQIQSADVDKLYTAVPKFEHFFRILAENALAAYQQRIANSLSLPARERYEVFCENYPSLIQSLPQKYVAAFIGVTPEFLSRMLNQSPARK